MMVTPYYKFNREERNLAAILYHLLLIGDQNLGRFLDLVKHTPEWALKDCEIYFEYAMLRDQWHKLDHCKKRAWIMKRLPHGIKPPEDLNEIQGWNEFFGLTKKPSKKFIQSPANWVLSRVDDSVQGTAFRELALLKWSFNIKPDIVIITGDKRGVCIETKFESKVGKYPTSETDKKAWRNRGSGDYVDQIECQRNLFEKVLEYPKDDLHSKEPHMQFVLLDEQGIGRTDVKGLSWLEVFDAMDKSESHGMVQSWLKRYEKK